MKTTFNLSPNYSKKNRLKKDIKFIIIHYTGMQSEIESIKRLKNPKYKVSCHYLINRKGKIIQMVKDKNIAWHAGKSMWKQFKNLNKNSIGIELVNKGHQFGYQNFSSNQVKSLIKLCKNLKKKYSIKKEDFLGHSDIAPSRKKDPGEKFPWKYLAKNNLASWHSMNEKIIKKYRNEKISSKDESIFIKNLYKFGYSRHSKKDIVKAFQRKFRQDLIDGKIDKECLIISKNLLKQ